MSQQDDEVLIATRRALSAAEKSAHDWKWLFIIAATGWVITAIGLHWGVCS